MINKNNGCCPSSGYDLFEQQVRDEFITFATYKGYDVSFREDTPWIFEIGVVDDMWRAYHVGHVRGRTFLE